VITYCLLANYKSMCPQIESIVTSVEHIGVVQDTHIFQHLNDCSNHLIDYEKKSQTGEGEMKEEEERKR
jgi:hypothetical protein